MSGRRLFLYLIFFGNYFQAQDLHFSRPFPIVPKNYPIRIFQSGKGHFFVLRHNRKAHDLTIERRSNETAEINYFVPLRLDSINSKHFNYANLDYLLIQHQNDLYFVFERELNNRKSIFCKHIDSSGKAGPFVEILSLTRQAHWLNFELGFSIENERYLMLESSVYFSNQSCKKSMNCYDLAAQKMIWTKALPIENSDTGSSIAFTCDSTALYYIQVRSEITGYKRKYDNHRQLMVPEFFHDSLYLVKCSLDGEEYRRKPLLSNIIQIHSFRLNRDKENLRIFAQISCTVAGRNDPLLQFYMANFDCLDLEQNQESLTPLAEQFQQRLRYYDGTDSELAADKDFSFLRDYSTGQRYFQLLERKEGSIYKEIVLWELNKESGAAINHYLLPRRMLSSETWSKFPDIGEAVCVFEKGQPRLYLAEAADNRETDPNNSVYYELKKKSSLRHCDLVQYRFLQNNKLEKKLLYHNEDFDFIPLDFDSPGYGEVIFYFTNGKKEKFARLKP